MPREPKRYWTWCRRLFRWCRLLVWFCILVVLGALVYLNRVGVPRFIQEQVETELRARGLDARLGRVRVRGLYELAAQDVQFGQMNHTNGPTLRIREAELRLVPEALRQFEIRIHSVGLRNGQLHWPLPVTNGPPQSLSVDEVSAELDLNAQNQWRLDHLSARFLGAELLLSATITNGLALRNWKTGVERSATAELPVDWFARLNDWAARLVELQVSPSSRLTVNIRGDGRDPGSFRIDLRARSPSVKIPAGHLDALSLSVKLAPSSTDRGLIEGRVAAQVSGLESHDKLWRLRESTLQSSVRFSLTNLAFRSAHLEWSAARAETRWVQANHLQLNADTEQSTERTGEALRTKLSVSAREVESTFAKSVANQLTADVAHSLTNFTAISGQWRLAVEQLITKWGETEAMQFGGRVSSPDVLASGPGDASWGAWSLIDALELDWDCKLGPVNSPELQLDSLHSVGQWRPPHVTMTRLDSTLYGGRIDASARLNVANRELAAQAQLDFDAHRIENLLAPAARGWLGQYTWTNPPLIAAEARMMLPAWTNAQPDWRREVAPTLQLAGRFEIGPGAFRGVPVSGAGSHFAFTNGVWRLTDLVLHRPEGSAKLTHVWHTETKDYYWGIEGRIDPMALEPLLKEPQLNALGMVQFSAPPEIRGEVWGRWPDMKTLGFIAHVTATNFSFRGEHGDFFESDVAFTNLVFRLNNVVIHRGDERITAAAVAYDVKEKLVFLTNAVARMEPDAFTRVLGPKIHEQLQPYRFQKPPLVHAHGTLPTTPDYSKVDAHFDVIGEDFSYWKFKTPRVSGLLHWHGDVLSITNVNAAFYDGQLAWSGEFDFASRKGSDFGFRAHVTDADLRELMADLRPATNSFAGRLNGDLVITRASSDDPKSWEGFGSVRLRDGFLWNIPIFGFFSSMLNAIVPNLGQSAVTDASGTFTVENSVVHTRDLEVRASALRLQYDGNVDMEGNVDARVQAEPLRDAWAVGRILNFALWPVTKLFEYKITGTLAQPEREPLHFPKLFLFPLSPVKTLRDLFLDEPTPPKEPAPK